MKRWLKKIGLGLAVLLVLVGASVGIYAKTQTSAFDDSMSKVYDLPLGTLTLKNDPETLARGKHLAESVGGCKLTDCHGGDFTGGKTIELGPLGKITAPNITSKGLGAAYSDAELLRLLRHGVKKDGRSVRLMPVQDFNWLPESDMVALISYFRTAPGVDKPNGPIEIGVLGKIMDRKENVPFDVARRVNHANLEMAGPPEPTAAYGRFIGRGCMGCHGAKGSGGPIPGAPPSLPVPLNITPHETGLKGWTFEDFDQVVTTGTRKDGRKLNPFMPFEALGKMNETEKRALFAYLQSLPPVPFGQR